MNGSSCGHRALPRGYQYCSLIWLASIKGPDLTKYTHIVAVDSCGVMAKSGAEPVWPFKDLYRLFSFLPALLSLRCHYL